MSIYLYLLVDLPNLPVSARSFLVVFFIMSFFTLSDRRLKPAADMATSRSFSLVLRLSLGIRPHVLGFVVPLACRMCNACHQTMGWLCSGLGLRFQHCVGLEGFPEMVSPHELHAWFRVAVGWSGSEVDVLSAVEAQMAAKPASELYSAQQRSVKPIGMVCLKIQHHKTDGWWLVDGRGTINCLFLWIIIFESPYLVNSYQIRISSKSALLAGRFKKQTFRMILQIFFPQLGVVSKCSSHPMVSSFLFPMFTDAMSWWHGHLALTHDNFPFFWSFKCIKINRGVGRSNPFLATEKSLFFCWLNSSWIRYSQWWLIAGHFPCFS